MNENLETREDRELRTVLSRIEHVLEHHTQDPNIIAAAIFQLFIEISSELNEEEFQLSLYKIAELRVKHIIARKKGD